MVERANVLKNETYVNLRKKFLREEENLLTLQEK